MTLEITTNGQTAKFMTGADLCRFWQRMKKVRPIKHRWKRRQPEKKEVLMA